jgi:hypothetical protein
MFFMNRLVVVCESTVIIMVTVCLKIRWIFNLD